MAEMITKRLPFNTLLSNRRASTLIDSVMMNSTFEDTPAGKMVRKRPGLSLSTNTGTVGIAQGSLSFSANSAIFINGDKLWCTAFPSSPQTLTVGGNTNLRFSLTELSPVSGAVPKVFLHNTKKAFIYDPATNIVTAVVSANYPTTTIPGVIQLDGTVYVATADGTIYGSDVSNPATWSALNFITPTQTVGNAIAIAKHLNYVVLFKERSYEFLYDAANPTGSPLAIVPSAMGNFGCAAPYSILLIDDQLYWMGQSNERDRFIARFNGYTPEIVSTDGVARFLNNSTLASVYASGVKVASHPFYTVTLEDTPITLSFDIAQKTWAEWNSYRVNTSGTVTLSLASDGRTVTVTGLAGLIGTVSEGAPVQISGASPSAYNNYWVAQNVTSTTFTFSLNSTSTTPSGTTTLTTFTLGEFAGALYAFGNSSNLFLDTASSGSNSGNVYAFPEDVFLDNGAPILTYLRTEPIDFGESRIKFFRRMEMVADQVTGSQMTIAFSDDDYASFSTPQLVLLNQTRPLLSCLGSARRRIFAFQHTSNTAARFLAFEVDFGVGSF